MTIISYNLGRLSNQLFGMSHFLAFSIKNNLEIRYPSFAPYASYFELKKPVLAHPDQIKVGNTSLQFLFRLLLPFFRKHPVSRYYEFQEILPYGQPIQLENLNLADRLKYPRYNILAGWGYSFFPGFIEYQDVLRKFFSPKEPLKQNCEKFIKKLKTEDSLLVGIHIRKGDYKRWRGGNYFYEDYVYFRIMKEIVNQIQNSYRLNTKFLICSDTTIDKAFQDEFDVSFGLGKSVEDLFSLSLCDLLIGPPSTYSLWASFYGKVPIMHIKKQDCSILLNNFCLPWQKSEWYNSNL